MEILKALQFAYKNGFIPVDSTPRTTHPWTIKAVTNKLQVYLEQLKEGLKKAGLASSLEELEVSPTCALL